MGFRKYYIFLFSIILLVFSVVNGYSLIIDKSLENLTIESESIVVGDVLKIDSRWEENNIFTYVNIEIDEYIKGKGDNNIVIKVPGGKVGDLVQVVSDTPVFQAGEKVLLFLKDDFFQIVGWYQGKYNIINDKIVTEGLVYSKTKFINRIRSTLGMPAIAEEGEDEPSIQAAPVITSITPSTTASGTKGKAPFGPGGGISDIVITGNNFGSGAGRVSFPANVTSSKDSDKIYLWSDTRIECHIPMDAHSGNLIVYPSGGGSGQFNYVITFGAHWQSGMDDEIKWNKPAMGESFLVNENCPNVPDELSAIQTAFNTWNNAGADFAFSYGGTTTLNQAGFDGLNIIAWNYLGNTDTIAGTSYWFYTSSGIMVEADIILNNKYAWSTTGEAGKADIISILNHELGHCLALKDLYGTADKDKVMYGKSIIGETKNRTLKPDDIAGIRYLYGTKNLPILNTFSINNNATTTSSQWVTLNNTTSGDTPTHYMASENSNFAGASWLDYSTDPSFYLSPGCGIKTVYLKVKNANGESNVLSDTIEYIQPPTITSFAINNGAATTISQTVILNNTATCSPTQYMASENSNFSGANWQTYSTAPSFTLSSKAGIKTVYLKVKNTSGESNILYDTIELLEKRNINLYPGFNFISISLDVSDNNITSVLSSITGKYISVWAYNSETKTWEKYIPGGPPELNNLSKMEPGRGYIIYMIENGQLEIIGKRLSHSRVQLLKGWNLVGYKSLNPKKPEDAFASIGDTVGVCTYDNLSAKWLGYPYPNNLDMMNPDIAYWIYANKDFVWDMED